VGGEPEIAFQGHRPTRFYLKKQGFGENPLKQKTSL
jgi:hypothetical protein